MKMWQKIKNVYHLGMAVLANIYYGFPSRKIKIVGVTGTDGKTTTTCLIHHILHTSKHKVSMISSVGAVVGGKNYDIGFHVTTPSPFAIQRFIKKAADLGSKFLILETTSHALDQYRVFGIKYEVGVLTNITHEHLDYHKTLANYIKTKEKLLKISKIAIANKDDESFGLLNAKLITYGMNSDADVSPKTFPFKTALVGKFNKYNVLAAICVCKALGIKNHEIKKGIETFLPPKGRIDVIHKKDFTVMIDFAHTPNAFDQILKLIRPDVKGRLIHVFGSAGLRDSKKRPIMGGNSSAYADTIILTSEDPRTESVDEINKQIESGIVKKTEVIKIPDRKKAIEKAIAMAKKNDFVLITGKAHEKSMNYGYGEIPWDEYEAVEEALDARC